jgi:hypothetical protein
MSSSKDDEDTIRLVIKVIKMIRKMNLLFLLNLLKVSYHHHDTLPPATSQSLDMVLPIPKFHFWTRLRGF